jgi:hypothetical protein
MRLIYEKKNMHFFGRFMPKPSTTNLGRFWPKPTLTYYGRFKETVQNWFWMICAKPSGIADSLGQTIHNSD